MAKKPDGAKRPIVVRREEVVEGGHHGGAWKVAYADFVTAMMAFFLLMWLINATTEAQRRGLADYFSPTNLMSQSTSGNGQPFGGHTPFDSGSLVSDRGAMTVVPGKSTAVVAPDNARDQRSSAEMQPRLIDDADGDPASAQLAPPGQSQPNDQDAAQGVARGTDGQAAGAAATGDLRSGAATANSAKDGLANSGGGPAKEPAKNPARDPAKDQAKAAAEQQAARDLAAREQVEKAAFSKAAQQVAEAVRNDPALSPIANQIAIDQTPEGLRIQLLDEEHLPMFATGSSALNDRARLVLQKIAPILARMSEGIAISGHTDAAPYRGGDRTNWELSADRANATRRLLVDAGLSEARLRSVTGNADKDLLLPADPLAAANRRIAIVALRDVRPARP
jgi:chemotaxis protein MotB